MSFTSLPFIFIFLPVILLGLFLLRRFRLPDLVISGFIAVTSLLFYAWGGITSLLLLLSLGMGNYILACCISRFTSGRKILLWAGVALNAGALIVCRFIPIAPLGLSFFTFTSIAYIVDVYWGRIPPEHNIARYIEYIFLFPKVCMGPITRYGQLSDNLHNHKITEDNVYLGIRRFCIGFSKKILLANQMGLAADTIFQSPSTVSAGYAWLGLLSYTLQIYLDFSAYSDMAIGLGLILGIHLPENFNYPYIATTIQDFWRRWHISLSSWFRDYVYIPLGGNRKGKFRTSCNLITVFLLTGIWHGASWNFVIWGIFHGVFQLLERGPMGRFLKKLPSVFQHVYALSVIMIGWVFFRTESFTKAIAYLGSLVGIGAHSSSLEIVKTLTPQYYFFLAISLLVAFPVTQKLPTRWRQHFLSDCALMLLFMIALCYMAAGNYNPFIYARF